MSDVIDTPYTDYTASVQSDWIDYNGHMNVGYYHVVFDMAVEPFFWWLGLSREYRAKNNATTFALESHLNYLAEVVEGDKLRFETWLLDFDHKRIHFFQQMIHVDKGYIAATHESVSVYVDESTRRTAPMPDDLQRRLAQVKEAHSVIERPWQVGHVISAHPPAKGG